MLVPHTGSPETLLVSRLSEVGWGVCVGVATAWAVDKIVRWQNARAQAVGGR
jgi:hypothetical protein